MQIYLDSFITAALLGCGSDNPGFLQSHSTHADDVYSRVIAWTSSLSMVFLLITKSYMPKAMKCDINLNENLRTVEVIAIITWWMSSVM